MTEYSILIVDADPDNIQQLSGMLRANGFKVAGTSSGVDALGMYKKESRDLVVADQELVDMSGLQLLSELKDFDPKVKVVITSSFGDKDAVASAFRTGALEFLEKPFEHQFFVSKIKDLIAREDRALEGDLRMMSLASIIQINCEERNQAQLVLNHQGSEGQIYFNEGDVIHAEVDDQTGDEAVYELLNWEDGSFRLKMDAEPSTRTINKGWASLLLEGMRRIDESTAGWSPDWDGDSEKSDESDEDEDNQLHERIVKALSNIQDVTGAMIYSSDGTVIAQDKNEDLESYLALSELMLTKTELITGFIEAGEMERVVLSGSDQRVILQPYDNNLVVLTLAIRSSAEKVFESAQTIYKRYRSAGKRKDL